MDNILSSNLPLVNISNHELLLFLPDKATAQLAHTNNCCFKIWCIGPSSLVNIWSTVLTLITAVWHQIDWKFIHQKVCWIGFFQRKWIPNLHSPMIENSLVNSCLVLTNISHWCWHSSNILSNSPIGLSLDYNQWSQLSPPKVIPRRTEYLIEEPEVFRDIVLLLVFTRGNPLSMSK